MSRHKRPKSSIQSQGHFAYQSPNKAQLNDSPKKPFSKGSGNKLLISAYNDVARIVPQAIAIDKERLYCEALQFKRTLNEITEQNVRLKTKLRVTESRMNKKDNQLQYRKGNWVSNNKPFQQKMDNVNFSQIVQQTREESENMRRQLSQLKQRMKYTKSNDLQDDRDKIYEKYRKLVKESDLMRKKLQEQQRQKQELQRYKYKSQDTVNELMNKNNSLMQKLYLLEKSFQGDLSASRLLKQENLRNRKFNEKGSDQEPLRRPVRTNNHHGGLGNQEQITPISESASSINLQSKRYSLSSSRFDELKTANKKIKDLEFQNMELNVKCQQIESQLRKAQSKIKHFEDQEQKIISKYNEVKLSLENLQQIQTFLLRQQKQSNQVKYALQKQLQKQKQSNAIFVKKYDGLKLKLQNQLLEEKQKNKKIERRQSESKNTFEKQLQGEQQKILGIQTKFKEQSQKQKKQFLDFKRQQSQIKDKLEKQLQEHKNKASDLEKQCSVLKDKQKKQTNLVALPVKQKESIQSAVTLKLPEEQLNINEQKPKLRSSAKQFIDDGLINEIKEILTYKMKGNQITCKQVIQHLKKSQITKFSHARLLKMLTAYPFYLTPHYAIQFLKDCYGYTNVTSDAQLEKQALTNCIEKFVQEFSLPQAAQIAQTFKKISSVIFQKRTLLQKQLQATGAQNKCVTKQKLTNALRNIGGLSEDENTFVICRLSNRCQYLDKINYQHLFYEFDIYNSLTITKKIREILTYRMKFNRLKFQQLSEDITKSKIQKFKFKDVLSVLKTYPFELAEDYAKEFVKKMCYKEEQINDNTQILASTFITNLRDVVQYFQLLQEDKERQHLTKIADIMFKNRYSLQNQFQCIRQSDPTDNINKREQNDNNNGAKRIQKAVKVVCKQKVIYVLQKIGLNSFQIQLAFCCLAAKCQYLDRIKYSQLSNFFRQFNIYLWSPAIKQIRQLLKYRMRCNRLTFAQLEEDIKRTNHKTFLYKDLLALFQLEPFKLSLSFAQQFLRICYGKQSVLSKEPIYYKTLISHLRNVVDNFEQMAMTVPEQKQMLQKISKVITDNQQSLSNYFKKSSTKMFKHTELKQILQHYLSDKRQVQLVICHISRKCQKLSQITESALFEYFLIRQTKSVKNIPQQKAQTLELKRKVSEKKKEDLKQNKL